MSEISEIWRDAFATWPTNFRRKGVVVPVGSEAIPFCDFVMTESMVVLERATPDNAGARRVAIPFDRIHNLKYTEPLKTDQFLKAGFVKAMPKGASPEKPVQQPSSAVSPKSEAPQPTAPQPTAPQPTAPPTNSTSNQQRLQPGAAQPTSTSANQRLSQPAVPANHTSANHVSASHTSVVRADACRQGSRRSTASGNRAGSSVEGRSRRKARSTVGRSTGTQG